MENDAQHIRAAVEKIAGHENKKRVGMIRLAYLHGSRALGKADEESDIDIAVLVDPSFTKDRRFRLRMHLMRSFAEALSVPLEKIDLVILQDIPALLRFNIIRNGVLLFEKDRTERIAYELQVEQQYDDERYYLERESKTVTQRILSRPVR